MRRKCGNVIRGFLIDIIVKPVVEEQIGMAPPLDDRREGRIIIRIIVAGNLYG